MENHLLLFACLCLYPKYEGGKADVPNLIRCHYQTSPFQNSMTGSWFSHVTSPWLRTTNIKANKTSRFQSFLSPSLTIASYLALCSIFSRSFFILRNGENHCSKVTKTNDTPPKKHILLDAFNVTTKIKFKNRTARVGKVREGKCLCVVVRGRSSVVFEAHCVWLMDLLEHRLA